MKKIREIRLENLLDLSEQYKSQAKFCEKVGVSPSYFSRIKGGTKMIGDELASQVETRLDLPAGWMDHDHEQLHEAAAQRQSQKPFNDAAHPASFPQAVTSRHHQVPGQSAGSSAQMGAVYAIESLPEGLRQRVVSLLYEMAAEFAHGKQNLPAEAHPGDVFPFISRTPGQGAHVSEPVGREARRRR